MFQFHNGGCLAFMFSSFLMTFFLLLTERWNKIRVRKGKFFDEGIGSVSADVSVVCRRCVDRRVGRRVLYLYWYVHISPNFLTVHVAFIKIWDRRIVEL